MTVFFVLLPLALLTATGAVVAFLWATNDGQLDDLDTPALRILHEDDAPDATRRANAAKATPVAGKTP